MTKPELTDGPLNLDTAIVHAEERATTLSGPCAAQHAQLATWLRELQERRKADSVEPVRWGAPKTVKQLIRQLQTLAPDLETTALLRMPADFRDGNAIRKVPLSISYERMDGQWLAPYKSEHRKVLAFWARPDDRNEAERGELIAPRQVPVVPEEIEPDHDNTYDYVDGWNACRAAMLRLSKCK